MKRLTAKLSTFLLTFLLILQTLIFIPGDVRADSIDDFVTRCYKIAFERTPDEAGFDYWKDQLIQGRIDGSVTAFDFIFSNEYLAQQTSDKQYIKDLYEMFMGREPDADGYNYWIGTIAESSRESVFEGFANSDEFYNICAGYGIPAGYFTQAFPLDQVNNVNLFVDRTYQNCLGRLGDKDGQNYWTCGLLSGQLTGSSCASNFVFSEELAPRIEDDPYMFLSILYSVFMGREPDDDGINYWALQMSKGFTKEYVFAGFVGSPEFDTICSSYGIVRGEYSPSSEVDQDRADLINKFESLEGVSFIGTSFSDNYLWLKVEQPVDWNNPNGEKFEQLVSVCVSDFDGINTFTVHGYQMSMIESEIYNIYGGNHIAVEHRFFAESVPDGFYENPSKYWKYLTMENAAADFHHIISLLKQVFNGKWVFNGASKGGCITNFQSLMYPDDADVYVAYVAPLFSSTSTPGLGDYLYTRVGDERFGKEKAAELRDLMTDYQVMLLEERDLLEAKITGPVGYNGYTADQIYDTFVMDEAIYFWQYGPEPYFVEDILDKYQKGDASFEDALYTYINSHASDDDDRDFYPEDYDPYSPFVINCAREIGAYKYEFQYLRDILKERGSDAYISFSADEENDIYINTFGTPIEEVSAITFDTSFYRKMVDWTKTTNCTVIEIYGSSDVISAFKYPEAPENPNYHVFTAKDKCHDAYFSDTEIWPEVKKILDGVLLS